MQLNRTKSVDEAKRLAREELEEVLKSWNSKPVLLLLSGGSSLGVLEGIDERALSTELLITTLDERYSSDPGVNNWLQIKETGFYRKAMDLGCRFVETVPKGQESLEKFAARWEKELRDWRKKNPHGKIVATIGIGEDGHVAGISPFPNDPERMVEFMFTKDWVKGYVGNLEPAERVSVTAMFLEQKVDVGVVYVVGEKKRRALERVVAVEGRLAETPARILREMEDARVFTDLSI